jgi:hypothetical protein
MSYISEIKVKVCYPVDWEKVAEATKVLLIPESNLDRNDSESLMFNGERDENFI